MPTMLILSSPPPINRKILNAIALPTTYQKLNCIENVDIKFSAHGTLSRKLMCDFHKVKKGVFESWEWKWDMRSWDRSIISCNGVRI
jgi:hypothetical protein